MATPLFELTKILTSDAKEIIAARDKAFAIHGTNDIDAAGDEIEQVVRKVLRRKIPLDYYLGHGHIVDENLNYNGQHDIIIADNSGSPILFTAENGTEYFPYESIYAFGEIKSTYYSAKKHIQTFISRITNLYTKLSRQETSPSYITKDLNFERGGAISISSNDKRPYRNPLFKFMFFVDSGDLDIPKLKEILDGVEDKYLPNFICFLNKGILVKSHPIGESPDLKQGPIELFPEFSSSGDKSKMKWSFMELGNNTDPLAAHLAFVIFALNQHLKNCLVLRPDLIKYFNSLFKVKSVGLLL